MFFSKNFVVGLDVQPNAIHLIQLDANQMVSRCITIQTEHEIMREGKFDHWQALANYLRELVQQNGLRGCKVAFSLPTTQVHMHYMQVPAMPSMAELDYEIEKYIVLELPWLKEALYKDFHIHDEVDSSKKYITLVISRKTYIEQLQQCLQLAKLTLAIVDVDIFALHRLIHHLLGVRFTHKRYLIITLYQKEVQLLRCDEPQITLLQQWDKQSNDLSTSLAQAIALAMQLVMDKPTALVFCGDAGGFSDLLEQVQDTYHLKIFYPHLPVDEVYWLAYSLALREVV